MATLAPPLIAVVGPTASGKSALALRLARELGGEVVSCDSLQVYRGLDIGSAKATPAERALVPHHLLDAVEPHEPFSAADYSRLAREALASIRGRGRRAIVAGGTGLYLRALLGGLFEGPSRDEALRARLGRLAERHSSERLHRLLGHVDPPAAARTNPRDLVRIVRALEVYWLTGRPISREQQRATAPLQGFRTLLVGLAPDRSVLRRAVEARTRRMLADGLVRETEALLARYGGTPPRPLLAIGYRQALSVLRGELTLEAAEREIVTRTMRFAKRQMTWFRHQADVEWFGEPERAYERARAWLAGEPGRPLGASGVDRSP